MTAVEMNDAAVLDQLREHWQKVAALLVWKLAKREPVRITSSDLDAFDRESNGVGAVLLTIGHHDAFTFRIVTDAEAAAYAAHEQGLRGSTT